MKARMPHKIPENPPEAILEENLTPTPAQTANALKSAEMALARKRDPKLMAILENPALSDEEKCKAIFGKGDHVCAGCGIDIDWPGACDKCVDEFDKRHGAMKTIYEQLEVVGVPKALIRCSWANFEFPSQKRPKVMGHRINTLKTWAGKPERICLIGGPPGTGKTHMAVATMRRRVQGSGTASCHFVHCGGLVRRVGDWNNPEDPLRDINKDRFLILDDWGQDMSVDNHARATLIGFLLRRLDNGLVTMITTNWTATDFESVEPRLASRLQEALQISTRGFSDMRGK